MRKFGDYLHMCPKCDSWPDKWSVKWRDAFEILGAGDRQYDYHKPEHLEVQCPNCGWMYEMEPADAAVEALP